MNCILRITRSCRKFTIPAWIVRCPFRTSGEVFLKKLVSAVQLPLYSNGAWLHFNWVPSPSPIFAPAPHHLPADQQRDKGIVYILSSQLHDSSSKAYFVFSQRSYMETKGWDVFRSLPPETDSSSEAVDKWLGTTVKILKVRKQQEKRDKYNEVISGHCIYTHILRGTCLWCRHKGHHTLHDQPDQTR